MITVPLFRRIHEISGRFPQWLRVTLLCLAVLVPALALTYGQVLLSDRANLSGGYDIYREIGPLAYFMDYSIHHGDFPLWNPLTLCGMPYAANPVTACFYPGNLIRSLLTFHPTPFKTQVGWLILAAIHLLLTGVGIVFMAREHRLSYPAAFLAAIAFLFSAIWVRRTCEYHFLTMIAWFPWLLLLTRRAMTAADTRTRLRRALLASLILGMALLSGSANMAPYLGLTICVYALLYRLLHLRGEEREGSHGIARILLADSWTMVLLFVLGGLIASVLYLPGAEFAKFSSRAKESDYKLADQSYKGSPRELYQTMIRFPGLKWEVENIRGAGIAAMLLALVGLTHRRRREAVHWAALFLVLFDCSMGPPWPIATLVARFCPIQLIATTRAFDFALLPFGILAGLGVEAITAREEAWPWRMVRSILVLIVGLVCLNSLSGLLGPNTFLSMSSRALVAPALALTAMVAACWFPAAALWRTALVLLVFAETLVWNLKYAPHIAISPNYVRWAGVYEGAESFWPDNRRGAEPVQNRNLYALRPAMNGYEPVHIARVRALLANDARGKFYFRSVRDYEITRDNTRGNLLFKRAFWLARQYVRGPLREKEDVFPPTTTVYLPEADAALPVPRVEDRLVPHRAVSDQVTEIRFIDPAAMTRIQNAVRHGNTKRTVHLPVLAMPGVHSALSLKLRATGAVTVSSEFKDPSVNSAQLGKTVRIGPSAGEPACLELSLPDFERLQTTLTFEMTNPKGEIDVQDICLLADQADENRLIRVMSRSADRVEVEVGELTDHRILVFLDADYPGWKAYVDSSPAPILLANGAFKAVALPPGLHRVVFEFHSSFVSIGACITLVSVALVVLFLFLLRHSNGVPRSEMPSTQALR